jgi:hypothetical protein
MMAALAQPPEHAGKLLRIELIHADNLLGDRQLGVAR